MGVAGCGLPLVVWWDAAGSWVRDLHCWTRCAWKRGQGKKKKVVVKRREQNIREVR
jgi:hypothetical protein